MVLGRNRKDNLGRIAWSIRRRLIAKAVGQLLARNVV